MVDNTNFASQTTNMIYTTKAKVPEGELSIDPNLKNARLIQQGLLPKARDFKRLFNESFTLYLPKDVVSGDFYWVGENHGVKYVVAGDCTGHGVSAALLSVLAINLFEYAIMNKGLKRTDAILREVDKKFIESFKDEFATIFDNPWVDLAIIAIDENKQCLEFSSANRKIVQINREGKTEIFAGSRYPIGGWQLEDNRSFSSTKIPYDYGDMVYLGSDGFQDQLGGPTYKKYKSKRLHEFLSTIYHHPLSLQKSLLYREFKDWKGKGEQVDDVCLIGLRL